MKKKRDVAIVAMCVAALVLSGCSAWQDGGLFEPGYDSTDVDDVVHKLEKNGYTEAAETLTDGFITYSEWHHLHMLERKCFEQLGMEYQAPVLDPVNQTFYVEDAEWLGEGYGPEIEDADKCYSRYQGLVGTRFIRDHEPRMAPELLSATWACLDEQAVSYSGEETKVRDFFPAMTPGERYDNPEIQQSTVADCVRKEARNLYPTVSLFDDDFMIELECGRECWGDQ